jgi:predicted enzyme related to lactoylglutathione lyase
MPHDDHSISYLEFPLTDAERTKSFFSAVFGWEFQDWGPDYLSFTGAKVDGGFNRERKPGMDNTGPLVVLFADDLDKTVSEVKSAGAKVSREIYDFPGGRRFHFIDPNGNEMAVWG